MDYTDRQVAAIHLFWSMKDGKVPYGEISKVAQELRVHANTIGRLWRRAQGDQGLAELTTDIVRENVRSRTTLRGRKPKHDRNALMALFKTIPKTKRCSVRAAAAQMEIPKTTLWNWILGKGRSGGFIRPHSNAVKPFLTEENKQKRIDFVKTFETNNGYFEDMEEIVHVDEKWFYMTELNMRIYLAEGEEEPHRQVKHKGHVEKVMVLTAVARPRELDNGTDWDGKIGCFFFVEWRAAQRSSRNRPAGTMEMKAINCTKETYVNMMIEQVLPAIKAKCPREMQRKNIRIQQDNATPHNSFNLDDPVVAEKIRTKCEELRLAGIVPFYQPPNSPDTNVLDLGFFAAIQSLQYQESPTTWPTQSRETT